MIIHMTQKMKALLFCGGFLLVYAGCTTEENQPRLSMFVGVDVSGSFVHTEYYANSLAFLAHYIYAHVNGVEGFEKPNVFFIASIGGMDIDDPKTFHPIQSFENKSVEEIEDQLWEMFPTDQLEPVTDFNTFFEHIARTVQNHNLVLRPISVILLSDGIPDYEIDNEQHLRRFSDIDLHPLERLSRNVTIRLLYSNPSDGRSWQTEIPRRRVKIWTQDAEVMKTWNDPKILFEDRAIEEQDRWISWTRENVNYNVRSRRVD
ncbi:MAG: hypothetical protein WD266_03480 [Balneolales bacterium]